MVNFPELYEEKRKEVTDAELLKYIREYHHKKAEDFVKNYKDIGLQDVFQAEIVGRISKGHQKEDLKDNTKFKNDQIYRNTPINVPLLASLLRIADELDLTFERVPLILYDHIPPANSESKLEWQKHLSISGVSTDPLDPLTIKCDAICQDSEIHRRLKNQETKINDELSDLRFHLHQYRNWSGKMPNRFIMRIESRGYEPYDIRLSAANKEIIQLLMGPKIYNDRYECIRELLKNSIDACKIKEAESKLGKEQSCILRKLLAY